MPDASLGGRDTHTLREHLDLAGEEIVAGNPFRALGHINSAVAQLDAAVATETRIKTPGGFFLWKPARIVLDWTPGSNEPPAHGWPDPVASSPGAPRSNT